MVRMHGVKVAKLGESKYFGPTVQSNWECRREVKKRVQAGSSGWRRERRMICNGRVPERVRRKVYRVVVKPAVRFGGSSSSLPGQ